MRRRGTRAQWAERVRQWRASGLTARGYATRERLNARTLTWWSSALLRAQRAPGGFIEVAPEVKASSEDGRIEIVLRDTVRIRVSGAFDPAVLRLVVAALETR